MSKKNEVDLLDNEIWVIGKIDEAKQETEGVICEKIKALNYEKTIKELKLALKNLTKQIELVDYNKSRELEGIEEDFNIKIDDIKVIEDSILTDKIVNITEETIKENISSLKKYIEKLYKELKNSKQQYTNKESIDKCFSDTEIAQIDELKNSIKKIESDFNAKIASINNINEEVLTQKIIESTQKDTSKSIEDLEKKLNKKHKEIVDLEIKKVNEQVVNAEQIIRKNKELSTEKFESLKRDITSVNEKTQQLINDKAILNGDIKKLQENKDEFKKQLSELESTSSNLLEFKKNTDIRIEEANESDNILKAKIKELKKQLSELESTSSNLLEFKENTNVKIEKVDESKEILKKQIEELSNKLSQEIISLDDSFSKQIDKINADEIKKNIVDVTEDVSELKSINQRKLDKLRKEQEKFIEQKIKELNTNKKIDEVRSQLNNALKDLKETNKQIEESQEENLKMMKDYMERRILNMRFATTTQRITQEMQELKDKVNVLQKSLNDNTDNSNIKIENIDIIVEQKVKEVISQIMKEQKERKSQKTPIRQQSIAHKIQPTVEIRKEMNKQNIKQYKQDNEEIYNKNKEPKSLDDMINRLKKSPLEKTEDVVKTISTISKKVKKCQILNCEME